MFGAKLRTWMENHIVRPRKKSNKSKNNTSGCTPATNTTDQYGNTDNFYKQKHAATGYTVYHGNGTTSPHQSNCNSSSSSAQHTGCSSVISSPVRRREVSPIQNHTQSRYGWQSPDEEHDHVVSPKSDNILYSTSQTSSQPYLKSPYSYSHSQSHSQDNTSGDYCKYQHQKLQQQQHQHKTQTQQHQLNCSTSSFSSLSWSTGSKEPSMNSNNVQNSNGINNKNNNSNNKLQKNQPLSPTTLTKSNAYDKVGEDEVVITLEEGHGKELEQQSSEEDPNAVHYEEIGTLIRHPEHYLSEGFSHLPIERPKSEQFSSTAYTNRLLIDDKLNQDDNISCYGRLLPSKIANPIIVSFRTGSEECITPRRPQHAAFNYGAKDFGANSRAPPRNKFRYTVNYGPQEVVCGDHVASRPLVSLSSPESAYSTGYSTDNTSPGAGYTPPEYYINMRTGTHYFPKSINSLAIEAQRYKFGLNKIEEMSPIEPLPKSSFSCRKNEVCIEEEEDAGPLKMPNFPLQARVGLTAQRASSPQAIRNTIVMPTLKGFESPSPRQRCRIRTNPWYATNETTSSTTLCTNHIQPPAIMLSSQASSMTISSNSSTQSAMVLSSATTLHRDKDIKRDFSPGIKSISTSSSLADGSVSGSSVKQHKMESCVSSESSSSLTEVENEQRSYTPNTMRRKRSLQVQQQQQQKHQQCQMEPVAHSLHKRNHIHHEELPVTSSMSDDDATLNEMMGKFDESYVYEKETDILSSDSDPTDCLSDLDTGQDAGDECDTDELLDIDFIDTPFIAELNHIKDPPMNLAHCYYNQSSHSLGPPSKNVLRNNTRNSDNSKTWADQNLLAASGIANSQRRRKRYHKTRKKSSENRSDHIRSSLRKQRETRSVGGTPVCLRKHLSRQDKERYSKTTPSPLSQRSNSLIFMDNRVKRYMTVSESEKALLKADFEADIKYRQLIMEAESLLNSMKNSMQSIPRETPVASPRRNNPLANKRVEMIKNCEIEPKRDVPKNQPQQQIIIQPTPLHNASKLRGGELTEQELTAAVNKRIELLKHDLNSPPSSPKRTAGSCSPRKTHLTNFINQNLNMETVQNRKLTNSPLTPRRTLNSATATPKHFKSIGTNIKGPSRTIHLDFNNLSDSDQESYMYLNHKDERNQNYLNETNSNPTLEDVRNRNYIFEPPLRQQQQLQLQLQNEAKLLNCPQSEPLKRKVYTGAKAYEQLKRDYQQETVNLLTPFKTGSSDFQYDQHNLTNEGDIKRVGSKTALIVSTIEDLKRNLEHQSLQLNGLNES